MSYGTVADYLRTASASSPHQLPTALPAYNSLALLSDAFANLCCVSLAMALMISLLKILNPMVTYGLCDVRAHPGWGMKDCPMAVCSLQRLRPTNPIFPLFCRCLYTAYALPRRWHLRALGCLPTFTYSMK